MESTTENITKAGQLPGVGSSGWLGWIDINDRKPKVGKKVLVCGIHGYDTRWRALAAWQPAGSLDASNWDEAPDDWWNEDGTVCTNPTDEWMEEPIEAELSYELSGVTHWMQLPALPNAKALAPPTLEPDLASDVTGG